MLPGEHLVFYTCNYNINSEFVENGAIGHIFLMNQIH